MPSGCPLHETDAWRGMHRAICLILVALLLVLPTGAADAQVPPGPAAPPSTGDDAAAAQARQLDEDRIEAERLEAERIEAERLEAERIEAERIEAERLEAERIERERREDERRLRLTQRLQLAPGELQQTEAALLSALVQRNRVSGDAVVAGYDLQLWQERLATAELAQRRVESELAQATDRERAAKEALGAYVGQAYRSGLTARTGPLLAVDALLQSRNPKDFVQGLAYLESVTTDKVERVGAAASAIAESTTARAAAVAAKATATEEITRAEAARAGAEAALPAREDRLRAALGAHTARAQGLVRYAQIERTATLEGDPHPSRTANVELAADIAAVGEAGLAHARSISSGSARILAGSAGVRPWADLRCPVDGPVQFLNDWGFPRTGGRSHEGTDVFAPKGAPVVAMADGVVVRVSRHDVGLGGLAVTYDTDGHRIYNAHLDTVADGIEAGVAVRVGQVLGSVGTTGNAKGTPPHNHLGISLASGAPVNPYPVLRAACDAAARLTAVPSAGPSAPGPAGAR
jgi:murein DD-endopeptidase MepM/ murein hydrolase activator NlpD